MAKQQHIEELRQMLGLFPSKLWTPNFRKYWTQGCIACIEGKKRYQSPYLEKTRDYLPHQAWVKGWEDTDKYLLSYYQKIFEKVQNSN